MTPDAERPTADTVDERGVTITAEGRARARRQLDEANARWTPEQREQRRQDLLARLDAA